MAEPYKREPLLVLLTAARLEREPRRGDPAIWETAASWAMEDLATLAQMRDAVDGVCRAIARRGPRKSLS